MSAAPAAAPVRCRVEGLADDARGVARVEGKAVFVAGALPGEAVSVRYLKRHSRYDEAVVDALVDPHRLRVQPRCPHFGVCGGCSLQHLDATAQVAWKQTWLLDTLARIGRVEPEQVFEPITGPSWGYRRRARLGVRYVRKKGRVLVGFRERANRFVADLDACEVLDPRVGHAVRPIAEALQGLAIRAQVPQIEVAAGDDSAAICLRVLRSPGDADRARLRELGARLGLQVYLQPAGPESVHRLWPESGELHYKVDGGGIDLAFLPVHFIQVNGAINRRLVARALELLALEPEDRMLDLYCGLGNFALPAARRAAEVVGLERERGLVDWARRNAARNGIGNARFAAADLARPDESGDRPREGIGKALLDPPRSGAMELLPYLAGLGLERLVYVSCHPGTLARDLGVLVREHGFRLRGAGVVDMFPHTAHLESIALLERGGGQR